MAIIMAGITTAGTAARRAHRSVAPLLSQGGHGSRAPLPTLQVFASHPKALAVSRIDQNARIEHAVLVELFLRRAQRGRSGRWRVKLAIYLTWYPLEGLGFIRPFHLIEQPTDNFW